MNALELLITYSTPAKVNAMISDARRASYELSREYNRDTYWRWARVSLSWAGMCEHLLTAARWAGWTWTGGVLALAGVPKPLAMEYEDDRRQSDS